MASFGLELQVWYGILLKPARANDPECPPLPEGACRALDSHGPALLGKIFTQRGYAGEDLTWLCYEMPGTSYWSLAVTASVQRSTRSPGRVNTTYPEDVAQRWADSLAQAAQILGLPGGVRFDWYQTSSYELPGSQA